MRLFECLDSRSKNEGARRASRAALAPGHEDSARLGARPRSGDDYVFAGQPRAVRYRNMALPMMLRRMKHDDIAARGFRSTFSDWASEVSSFSGELRETALAHTIQNKAERAYRRGEP